MEQWNNLMEQSDEKCEQPAQYLHLDSVQLASRCNSVFVLSDQNFFFVLAGRIQIKHPMGA